MSLRAVLAPYHDDPTPLEGILQRPPFEYRLDFAHLRLWEITVLFPSVLAAASTYRSLVFVRDPYQRFVSGMDQYFKTYCPDLLPRLPPEQQVLIIETLAEKFLRFEMLRTDHRFVHFSPQVWFIQSGEFRLPGDIVPMDDHGGFIARGLESLGRPPCAVPHDNRSRFDLTHVLTSPRIRAFVREFYAEDFAFLAADPALAHLAEPSTSGVRPDKPTAPSGKHDDCPSTGEDAAQRGGHIGSQSCRAADRNCAPNPQSDTSVLKSRLLSVRAVSSPRSADARQSMDAAELVAVSAQIDRAAVDLAAGHPRAAFDRVSTVLAQYPDFPRALGMLGQIAVFADLPAAGLAPLQRAVALDPRLEHRIWLALCLAKLGCPEDAAAVISAGVQTMPPTANANFAVGIVFYALGRYEDAARFYGNCIALDAKRADARHRYARALQAAGEIGSAVDAYVEAIRNCNSRADYYADLSGALSDLGRFEEAYTAGEAAVDLDPGCTVAQNNLGHALLNLNRSADAVAAYQKAIEGCFTYAKAQFGHALALLKSGEYERGWRHYEWRWQDCQTSRLDLAVPVWRGEDLRGRAILLHAEQGLGDTLQFVRFAPLVASRGGHVILEVPASLVRLMRCVEGVAKVIACGDPVPPIDLHCPMASLPLAFDLRLETIPASPYLRIPPEASLPPGKASHVCRAPSTDRAGLVVGLVWAGDPRHSEQRLNLVDRRRSTTLEVLAPLLDIDGVRFVSFQFGEARRQLAASKRPVVDGMEDVADFADTAARLVAIDLLISVDTSMVHLAGGLGVPVWMLSRFDGCWRWLERRNDTPWYPSMRIFRQQSPGDWPSVVAEVAYALRNMLRIPKLRGRLGPPAQLLTPSSLRYRYRPVKDRA
jgi:tetratricopeptide (TPR) repeat protein